MTGREVTTVQKTDIMIRAAVAAMSLTFVLGGTAVVAHASSPVYTNDETG